MKTNNENSPWLNQYKIDGISNDLEYSDKSLYEILEKSANQFKNNIALEYFGKELSYEELLNQIKVCAKALKSVNVSAGERVIICMPNTPEAVIMFYAVNAIGAVACMVHPLSAEGEIETYLNETEAEIAFIVDFCYKKFQKIKEKTKLREIITASVAVSMPTATSVLYWAFKGHKKNKIAEIIGKETISWESFLKRGRNDNKDYIAKTAGSDEAVVLFSGGTTGKPKGILLSHLNFNALLPQIKEMFHVTAQDSILGILPLFHGFGLGVCTHYALSIGVKIYLMPQFSLKTFENMIKTRKPTVIVGVPTLYEAFIKCGGLENVDLSFITTVVSGGDTLAPDLKRKVDRFLSDHNSKAVIREGYGLTECVSSCAVTPITNHKEGSIGIPFPGMEMKICDVKTKDEVAFGEEGEICISGPTVMIGYLNGESETKKTLQRHSDGKIWLHTGDLGKMDTDGYIYFTSRVKRIIITNGYNVYPGAIEEILNSHPDIESSVVVGVDDPYKQQRVKAVIVLKKGVKESDVLESIKQLCKKNISQYALPSEYEFKQQLPKTLIGKIDYRTLEGAGVANAE
ncbi:MAG: AMP-binding protein [Methanimicrococcus sp.]|nr:AMP-binding protein [Methanimicrococcus sp.]